MVLTDDLSELRQLEDEAVNIKDEGGRRVHHRVMREYNESDGYGAANRSAMTFTYRKPAPLISATSEIIMRGKLGLAYLSSDTGLFLHQKQTTPRPLAYNHLSAMQQLDVCWASRIMIWYVYGMYIYCAYQLTLMDSNAPLRTTYSALPSPLSSSEDIQSGNLKRGFAFPLRHRKQSSRAIPRHSFLIRIIVFALLEFGFIALASRALWKPFILDLSFTITEVKGAFTAIAILWHTIAIYIVKDILLNIFSAEWMEQSRLSASLTLQEVDSVSRLTTGFLDQTGHFTSGRATRSFRLAFLSSLLLLMLNGLGPSALSTDFVPYDHPHNIAVANLTIETMGSEVLGSHVGVGALAPYRANFITQLEVVEKNFTSYGFNVKQPNVLIPWPSLDPVSENLTTIRYVSDVVRYNFDCSWREPVKPTFDAPSWMAEGHLWDIYYPPGTSFTQNHLEDPLILPMRASSVAIEKVENSTLVAFLLVGRNSTPPTFIDLSGIPSSSVPCHPVNNPYFRFSAALDCEPLLASVLVCDPRFEVLPATVIGTASSLEAVISPGDPLVGNFPHQAAHVIYSNSLLDATSSQQPLYVDAKFLNVISRQLFLSNSSFGDPAHPLPVRPLSLPEINQNMNMVLASSAKAYLSGYKPSEDNIVIPSFAKMNTTGAMEVQKMAFVGSKPFLIALSAIDGLLAVLLAAIVAITRADQLEAFELENIIKRFSLLDQDPTFQEETGINSSP